MVELQSRIAFEYSARWFQTPSEFVFGVVGMDTGPCDRDEKGLGEPGNSQRRPEMGGGAVRRSNGHSGIALFGILIDRPARQIGFGDAVELARGNRLKPPAP